jgi:hypothetical protein
MEEVATTRGFGTSDLILHELLRTKTLSLLPSYDLTEYLSISTMKSILIQEIHFSGGRIPLSELQVRRISLSLLLLIFLSWQILCHTEMASIDQIVREVRLTSLLCLCPLPQDA